ncbi:MAG: energy transducer TonB [Marinoscillum sp.]|uniref:energy transducer TonB n=1 Tax=Marinoscillum sp. TaxID=2024838 RepID=UPI0032FE5582
MKKYIFSLALVSLTTLAFAASDPGLLTQARAINLEEVAESIKYPTVSNQSGVEGKVIMYLEIDAEGNISSTTALAYPCSKLKETVELALNDLKFEPAKNAEGEAVASALRIPFDFELKID